MTLGRVEVGRGGLHKRDLEIQGFMAKLLLQAGCGLWLLYMNICMLYGLMQTQEVAGLCT